MKPMIFGLMALSVMAGPARADPRPSAPETPSQTPQAQPGMKCETGPVTRTFGGNLWLVYSCDDKATIVVISSQGNPATPFYFILNPKGSGYAIYGEGNGDKAASDAAGGDLARLTPNDIAALIGATQAVDH